jgi:hypothetical protein
MTEIMLKRIYFVSVFRFSLLVKKEVRGITGLNTGKFINIVKMLKKICATGNCRAMKNMWPQRS